MLAALDISNISPLKVKGLNSGTSKKIILRKKGELLQKVNVTAMLKVLPVFLIL